MKNMNKRSTASFLASLILLSAVCFSLSLYLYNTSFNADAIPKGKYYITDRESKNFFDAYPWDRYDDSLPEIKDDIVYYYRNASFYGFISSFINVSQADPDGAIIKKGDNGFIFITDVLLTDINGEKYSADVAFKNGALVSIRISGGKQTVNNKDAENAAEQIMKEFNDFISFYYGDLREYYSIDENEGIILETQSQVNDIAQTKLIRLIYSMRSYDIEPLYMLTDQSTKAETVVKDGLVYFLAEGTYGTIALIYDCSADIWRGMTVYQ